METLLELRLYVVLIYLYVVHGSELFRQKKVSKCPLYLSAMIKTVLRTISEPWPHALNFEYFVSKYVTIVRVRTTFGQSAAATLPGEAPRQEKAWGPSAATSYYL